MNERGILGHRGAKIGRRGKHVIRDLDQVAGVLGDVPGLGNDDRHRLADVTRPIDGDGVIGNGRLDDAR